MVTIDGFIDKGAYSVEQWLTKQEVKKALKIDDGAFKKWNEHGKIITVKSRKYYYDEQELNQWLKQNRGPISQLKVGNIYNNQVIQDIFKCSGQGGMRRSHLTNALVLFSDHSKNQPIYEDKSYIDEHGNQIMHYTGMGQQGDQDLKSTQNRTLLESNDLSIKVYLFETFDSGQHTFRGEVKLCATPYTEQQNGRKVYIFPLSFNDNEYVIPETFYKDKEIQQENQAYKLGIEELYQRAKKAKKVGQRKAYTTVYERNNYVAAHVKERADGYCDLCGEPAPFKDKNGKPYLECHHVIWLAKQGEDSIDNAVALDLTCHRKMHVLGLENDVELLQTKIKQYKDKGM
ncbi:HNH endonuclease [Staphylococcus sp. GDX8P114P-2]|uniref:HNH endonuclease n=1 Tax=Staphylococcus sp. GDX8P114P-2 TaxID=2804111 RepID=UPI001AEC5FDD|nr:HNH endonuclease [Staphylococcus sp. GDX8P114P-2]